MAAAADDPPAPDEQKDDQTGPEAESKVETATDNGATDPPDGAAAADAVSQQLVQLSLSAAGGDDAGLTVNLTAA